MVPVPTSAGRPALRAGFRALVAVAAALAFVVAAKLADPASTSAQETDQQGEVTAPEPGANPQNEAYMGAIEGQEHSVRLFTTPQGPRYAVVDHLGHIVASGLYPDEVHAFLPGYDIQSMRADDALLLDSPLMLVDFD